MGSERPMGTTADGGRRSKGRAVNGDQPIGAARCRRGQGDMPTPPPPPPPPTAPSPGRPTPGVVKQDKSSGGSVDTTKTRSHPQSVGMSGGERPIGAAKDKQIDTEALCQPPPTRYRAERPMPSSWDALLPDMHETSPQASTHTPPPCSRSGPPGCPPDCSHRTAAQLTPASSACRLSCFWAPPEGGGGAAPFFFRSALATPVNPVSWGVSAWLFGGWRRSPYATPAARVRSRRPPTPRARRSTKCRGRRARRRSSRRTPPRPIDLSPSDPPRPQSPGAGPLRRRGGAGPCAPPATEAERHGDVRDRGTGTGNGAAAAEGSPSPAQATPTASTASTSAARAAGRGWVAGAQRDPRLPPPKGCDPPPPPGSVGLMSLQRQPAPARREGNGPRSPYPYSYPPRSVGGGGGKDSAEGFGGGGGLTGGGDPLPHTPPQTEDHQPPASDPPQRMGRGGLWWCAADGHVRPPPRPPELRPWGAVVVVGPCPAGTHLDWEITLWQPLLFTEHSLQL